MAAAYGIHFGATSACIAACKDGKAEVVANDAGERTTPAIVAFTDCDQTVGQAAKQGLLRNASNTICRVKQVLGRGVDEEEVQTALNSGPVKFVNKGGKLVYEVEYKEKGASFTPIQIASTIYKKMMDTAGSHGGQSDSHNAVITAPIHFTQQRKLTLCEAAEDAGFNVLRILNEPTAAVLAYDVGQMDPQQECNVMVFRIGGTSQDATVIHVSNGMYRILATTSNRENGGICINKILVDHFAAEFNRQWKCDCRENKRSIGKLLNAAENCKHILSTMTTSQASLDSLFEGIDFQCNMSRGRFEGLCGSFIQSCLNPLSDVLKQADLTKDDIHKVILCGGTAKIPLLQKQLQEYFPNSDLLCSIPPDEVIALGASKQASLLADNDEDESLRNEHETQVPCLSSEIFIQTPGEESPKNLTIFTSHTPVPVRRQHKFSLQADQTNFCMTVLLGVLAEPTPVAKVVMKDLPAGSSVTAVFHVKSDGSLHVTCSESSTNKQESVTIETS